MKSVLLTIVVLPLLQPVWQKEPFDSKNMAVPQAPTFLTNQQIQEQKLYFAKLKDQRVKSKIVSALAQANNPYAVTTLESLIPDTQNDLLISDILKAIYAYKGKVKISKQASIKKLLKSPDPAVRSLAAALYLQKTNDINTILRLLDAEESAYVSNFLTSEITEMAQILDPSEALLKKLATSEKALTKRNGLYLLALLTKQPDKNLALNKAVKLQNDQLRAAASQGLAQRASRGEELLMQFANDPNNSIRAFVANAKVTPEREPLYLKLANDKDWEVRRLACNSLANYKDDKAITTLLNKCKDKTRLVRDAAENALIKITPGNKARQQLIKLLSNKIAQDSAIKVLGAIKEQKAADKIFNILKKSKNQETQARAVTALGQLNFKQAWQKVNELAKSNNTYVRRAVVFALGEFAEPGSFDTIIALSKDKEGEVAYDAIKVMGKLASPHFNNRLTKIISDVSSNNKPEMRAGAAWALAQTNEPNDKIIKQLKKLCLKKVIKVEGMTMYDTDYVRMAACMALIDFAKKNDTFSGTAKTVVKRLKEPPLMDPEFNTEELRAFATQAFLYMNGKSATAKKVEPTLPLLTVQKTQKAKKSYRPAVNPNIVR